MSTPLDPVTGLPLDAPILDIQQIPLNTQPLLAPEFKPQGKVGPVLWPDKMPTVASTLQAFNQQNMNTVQAATTDGNGNLNVNVAAGGGGGGNSDLWATAVPSGNQRWDLNAGINDFSNFGVYKYYYAVQVDVAILDYTGITGTGVHTGTIYMIFNQVLGFMALDLGGYWDGTYIHGTHVNQGIWMPPSPIDISLMTGIPDSQARIDIHNNSPFHVAVNVNPVFGD